jgi:hypothetical protein
MIGLDNVRAKIQEFKQNQYVQGSKAFLESNGIVARFAFLILILFLKDLQNHWSLCFFHFSILTI